MKYETWGPTTYLFWAALMVVIFVADSFPVFMVCLAAFSISLVWQVVQLVVQYRQRKASSAHLEAWNYKG